MPSIYQTDIENRFPAYTVTVTTNSSIKTCTVTVTAGGAVVVRGKAAYEDGACLSARTSLHVAVGSLCCVTTTQRDALVSPQDGLVIFNTTANRIETRHDATWYG